MDTTYEVYSVGEDYYQERMVAEFDTLEECADFLTASVIECEVIEVVTTRKKIIPVIKSS